MNEKQETYWLTKAPVSRAIWHMAIPMMLGMCVNMIYGITDAFFIGKLNNTEAMAAVTLSMPFTTFLMAIGNLFGTGGSTFFSRLLGSKDYDHAKHCAAVSFWLAVVSGVICALLCIIFQNQIVELLGTDTNTFAYTKSFVIMYAIGSPFVIANFTLEQLIRGEGASITSMLGMVLSIVVNILLDPLLIFMFRMGVSGAALATVVGNLSAVIYYVICIKRENGVLSTKFVDYRPSRKMLEEVLKIGISAFLLDIFLIVSSLLFNYYVMNYGDYVIAGFGISQRIVQIVEFIGMGLYMGVIPLIAVAYGSGDHKRYQAVIRKTAVYLAIIITILVVCISAFSHNMVGLFSKDSRVIQIGVVILTVQLFASFFASASGLLTGIFQATGKGIPSLVMSVARGVLLIPLIVLLDKLAGLNGIILSLVIAEALSFVVGMILYSIRNTN